MALKTIALNCSFKASDGEKSSTDKVAQTAAMAGSNAAQLALQMKERSYLGVES